MIVHRFRCQTVVPVAFHFVAERTDHLAVADIATLADIDVTPGQFQGRVGAHPLHVLERLGHAAVDLLERAVSLDASSGEAHKALGDAYMLIGKTRQAREQAALAAGQPLRLRMQVRSFDAVCHLVAAGLGISVLPRAAVEPLAQAMGLTCRALTDEWAHRRLLIAAGAGRQEDEAVRTLMAHLTAASSSQERSPNAKARRSQ